MPTAAGRTHSVGKGWELADGRSCAGLGTLGTLGSWVKKGAQRVLVMLGRGAPGCNA
eukprot:gene38597-24309_t